ncbi:hypothetical protein QBC32DRAFT_16116 [Pseudoneurospora amorphoporcata]|uniref:Uncharacterized protein n=1 Tax=Pseudoneurospora amorphoporcata TaxID=241081 RepID=A0AAN6P3J3_9PEZI|nr:hypothetical protein QBC32DRAFT_16116 [Pseudoneurospora amorphoporcata]
MPLKISFAQDVQLRPRARSEPLAHRSPTPFPDERPSSAATTSSNKMFSFRDGRGRNHSGASETSRGTSISGHSSSQSASRLKRAWDKVLSRLGSGSKTP